MVGCGSVAPPPPQGQRVQYRACQHHMESDLWFPSCPLALPSCVTIAKIPTLFYFLISDLT